MNLLEVMVRVAGIDDLVVGSEAEYGKYNPIVVVRGKYVWGNACWLSYSMIAEVVGVGLVLDGRRMDVVGGEGMVDLFLSVANTHRRGFVTEAKAAVAFYENERDPTSSTYPRIDVIRIQNKIAELYPQLRLPVAGEVQLKSDDAQLKLGGIAQLKLPAQNVR